jgi:hypothetical protein
MIGSSLGENSNYVIVPREDPSPISVSFNFGALGKRLVVGFLGGMFSYRENNVRHHVVDRISIHKNETSKTIKINTYLFFTLA